MSEKPIDSWRARAAVSEALDVFNSSYMQEVWTKALARRESDPEGAVTSARTLLESLCKHILDSAGREYKEGLPLPGLYKLTAELLDIAPTEHTAPIFTALFRSCSEIIESVGRLRNHLSDSHGRGPFGTMPDWRHAELAVNLSAAMATYLAAVWKGRQPTVADAIRRFIERAEASKPLGTTHRYALERLARYPIGEIVASKLQVSDLVAFCEMRRQEGAAPPTLTQDINVLRGALGESSAAVFEKGSVMLRGLKYIGKSVPRERRPTHAEYDALISFFREQDKAPRTVLPMAEVMEFAVWSGRLLNEIFSLRWEDVNFEKRTCKLPGGTKEFPLLERAWDIVQARRQVASDSDERIFPYHLKTASARHTRAKKQLIEKVGGDLRFHDLRSEAATRLFDKGHPPHIVADATGLNIKRVIAIFEKWQASQERAESETALLAPAAQV